MGAPGLESTTSKMTDLNITKSNWHDAYENRERTKKAVWELLKELDQGDVACVLWEMAERKNIILVQTFTEEQLGLEKGTMPDVERIHEALSNSDCVLNLNEQVLEVVKEVIEEDSHNSDNESDIEEKYKATLMKMCLCCGMGFTNPDNRVTMCGGC